MQKICSKCKRIFNGREEHTTCGLCRNKAKPLNIPKGTEIIIKEEPKEDLSKIEFKDTSPDDCAPVFKSKKKKKHRK